MADLTQTGPLDEPPPDIRRPHAPLPPWLARRLLRAGETVTWVRGPRFNPRWERYVTHPGLFLAALALAAACVGVGRLVAGSWSALPPLAVLLAAGILVATVYVLAIANAYFTRLVVTDWRLVVLQGYEICRAWRIEDLPRSLLRYGTRGAAGRPRAVDLDALQTLLGGPSDQFTDAKTIRSLGKQLERIKAPDSAGG